MNVFRSPSWPAVEGPLGSCGPRRRLPRLLVSVALAMAVTGTGARPLAGEGCPAQATPGLADRLRNRLEAGAAAGTLHVAGHELRARNALPAFYLGREDAPAWISEGRPSSCAVALVAALRTASEDGLDGADYHRAAIDSLLDAARDASDLADLDLLLTDAFLTFGSHLAQGRVNPTTLEPEWLANRRQVDMAAELSATLERGDVRGHLDALRPAQPGYRALRRMLARLRSVQAEGGWGIVSEGPTIHPGDTDPRVPMLRRRMTASGDLDTPGGGDVQELDEDLARAVRRFQGRHGLEPDGNVGPGTLAAMNVPVEARIAQIEVNMERWRWLPNDLGRRHIRVNIADYRVEVWEDGAVALDMRAVVGREYRETPMFSATMTYLVLAPYWHVPPRIAAVDKLPEIRKNPGYLASMKMTLFDQATNEPVDPSSLDWNAITGAELNRRFRLRQDPGPLNALGNVKFMFPNRHNVYLHDTPSRELFGRTTRAFSSGCIRVEKPLDLADYLLAGDPRWSPGRIRAVVAAGQETTVWLERPVPVHILYWTAFAGDDGGVDFRPDLYGRDRAVRRALEAEPPAP